MGIYYYNDKYHKDYYQKNKEKIKKYYEDRKNNIPIKPRGRPAHYRAKEKKESLKVNRGKFIIRF